MKFTWKPITDINNLPKGVEIMVCIKENYCEYIRREGDAWFYVYTDRQIQESKVKHFTHYFIPRPYSDN